MVERSSYPHGAPSWADLNTPDIEAARAFYGGVFGWDFEVGPPETGGYTICTLRGRTVVGMMQQQSDQAGTPAAWTVYLSVDDADEAAKQITEARGTVVLQPMEVMAEGRMMLATDPSGAFFGCWQPGHHTGAQLFGEPGAMGWHELMSRAPDAARTFYTSAFGLEAATTDVAGTDYTVLSAGGEQVAGLMGMPDMVPAEVPSYWSVYFSVADTDAAVATVQRLGGSLIKEPTDMEYGRWAVVADDQGAVFCLIAGPESAG